MEMKAGESRKLIIPSDLGYGPKGAGGKIPGGATLYFDVTLIELGGESGVGRRASGVEVTTCARRRLPARRTSLACSPPHLRRRHPDSVPLTSTQLDWLSKNPL